MSVVKHAYISARGTRGKVAGKAPKVAANGRAIAHVKYIQHRPGEDRAEKGRELFNDVEDKLNGKDFRQTIRAQLNNKVIAHKLILAPEVNPDDTKLFTHQTPHFCRSSCQCSKHQRFVTICVLPTSW